MAAGVANNLARLGGAGSGNEGSTRASNPPIRSAWCPTPTLNARAGRVFWLNANVGGLSAWGAAGVGVAQQRGGAVRRF
jgi:hypothetical protein